MSRALTLVALVTAGTACQNIRDGQEADSVMEDSLSDDADASDTKADDVVERAFAKAAEQEKQRQAEELLQEEGFCKDDIYTRYLTSRFLIQQQGEEKPRRGRGRAAARQQRREREHEQLQALHYAAARLSPQPLAYQGGLPVVVTPDVQFWLSYFKTKGRDSFIKWLVRGEAVKHVLGPTLEKEGMPAELIYLSMIESGFSNIAHSHAQATGPWQFIAGTAKMYGLHINYWLDERRDPIKSTIAAATYMRDLYIRFGDWYLAMAAYNAGPGKVNAAIRKTGSRDFWDLSRSRHLKLETKHYVPKMLAALILGAAPQRHGFNVQMHPSDEFPKQAVYINKPVRLDELASLLGLPAQELRRWNPELLQGITPPKRWWAEPEKGYRLRLPGPFAERYASIEHQLSELEIRDVHMHRVRRGDTLASIARRYNVGVKKLMSFNPKLSPKRLGIGKMIAVPIPSIVMQQKPKDDSSRATAKV